MASRQPEDPINNTGETEEETIAQRRKRLRRVSFADREITSVHIFNRDEDYETPPNSSASKPQNGEQAATSESEDKVIRFFGDLADNEDSKELHCSSDTEGDGDAEDEVVVNKFFLRPKNSPSSGGSTIGSATTDDDDNFFGPVSAHFIKAGRLSDTTISEEHHDITMDSTAFSMHFRSLAMSEFGDLKTPMSNHLPVEDKTPTQVTSRPDTGSVMMLTKPKKLFPKSPLPVDKGSGGRDSNDMSLVGENSRKYDYGHISPTLEALLANESTELHLESSENNVKARSPVCDISLSPQDACVLIGQVYKDALGIDSSDACQVLSPYGSGHHPRIVLQESGSYHYMEEASLSSSTVRKQSVSLVEYPQSLSCVTPSPKQRGSFMSRETLALVESLSSIRKSKSRLGLVPSSPASALSQKIEKSKLQLFGYRSMATPSASGREEIGRVLQAQDADIPITNLEDMLSKHDNETLGPEKKPIPDQENYGASSLAVDNRNVLECINQEGISDSSIEGSILKQHENNHTASTPEKFVSSLENSSNDELASKNYVTIHAQEQHSEVISNSEPGGGIMTVHCASGNSLCTVSDKVDFLLAESGLPLSETSFMNGSAQQKEDSVFNENQNGINSINAAQFPLNDKNNFEVYCEPQVIGSSDDITGVVIENVSGTCGSSSMERIKNEASPTKGPSRLEWKATEDVDHAVRSLKVWESTNHISKPVMGLFDENCDASNCGVVCEKIVNWSEVLSKISIEINQLLAPLADKLDSRSICKLEDILRQLKKFHLCEMLCLQIQSQKVPDKLSGSKTKRLAESRSSLCKLAYEKAKLELLHLKHGRLLKKFQAVSTNVQASEILRLNCAKLLHQHSCHSTGLFNVQQDHEVATSKGVEKAQEINLLDSKIKNLIECVLKCHKMTGEPAYADIIPITEENLKKKMSCRFILQDMLAWKVDSLNNGKDGQNIVLNYSGLINQRLTLNPGNASWVLISNCLSDAFIKHFPDMNVSIAFKSLFCSKYSKKYVGSKTLLEITQKTSLVLHNLLDVAEEFQLARMEISNLVQGVFSSPSAEQLHLQISFVDCRNCRKVIMSLDLTCLIHGNYPSDIVPCELLEISGRKADGLVSKPLLNEIQSAMDDVCVGYPRILRLCRCISSVLQSQTRRCII